MVLRGPYGAKISYALRFGFGASNNEAEYEALVTALKLARHVGAEKVQIFLDSMLVVQQVKGEYEAKDEGMIEYLKLVRGLVIEFTSWSINKILRAENCEADRLSKYASIAVPSPEDQEERVFVEYLPKKTTSTPHVEMLDISIGALKPSWMDPIMLLTSFLADGKLPSFM